MGVYVRVMAAVGMVGDLALLATGESEPQVEVSASPRSLTRPHAAQDHQSLLMHRAAVRMLQSDPSLELRVRDTLDKWIATNDGHSRSLLEEWRQLIDTGKLARVLGRNERARELRQASPLTTILPNDLRLDIIRKVRRLTPDAR